MSTIISLLNSSNVDPEHALKRVEWIVDWARRQGPERGILKLAHFNALMHQYGVHGQWDKLMIAWRYVKALPGMEPDAVTYSSLLKVRTSAAPAIEHKWLMPTRANSWCGTCACPRLRTGRTSDCGGATTGRQSFVRRSHEQTDLRERKHSIIQAERVLAKMGKLGLQPDEKAFSLLLREYLASMDMAKVVETANAMKAASMQPEVVLNEQLRERALRDAQGGEAVEAVRVLEAMTAVKLVPDQRAYDALVLNLVLGKRFAEARRRADAMVAAGMHPADATYHIWLEMLARRGRWVEAQALMQVRVCVCASACVRVSV